MPSGRGKSFTVFKIRFDSALPSSAQLLNAAKIKQIQTEGLSTEVSFPVVVTSSTSPATTMGCTSSLCALDNLDNLVLTSIFSQQASRIASSSQAQD